MSLLHGRRLLVTGAASGIGAAIAARCAGEGATGVALDLPGALAEATVPDGWESIAADVRDEAAIREAAARIAAGGGALDGLVPCAGIVPAWSSLAQLDLAEYDAVMAVNARGVAATLKHAGPLVADGGAIAVVASLNAWRGDAHLPAYVASKHAALGLVRSAAPEFGERGVRVNALAPGPIATDALRERMARRAAAGEPGVEEALAAAARATATGRIATVDDVAGAALFLLSDLSAGISGQLLAVDGGLA